MEEQSDTPRTEMAEGQGLNPYFDGLFDGESDELCALRLTLVKGRDEARAEVKRLRKTLDEIAMYWNGSHSPTATLDAGRCRKSPRLRGGEAMSIDEVMKIAAMFGPDSLRAAIEQHVAEEVERETERCALIADKWATDEQRKFGNGGPAADIRARAEIGRHRENGENL